MNWKRSVESVDPPVEGDNFAVDIWGALPEIGWGKIIERKRKH